MKRHDYLKFTIQYIVKLDTIFYVVKYNMVDDKNTSTKKTIQLSDSFLSMNKTKKASVKKKKKEKSKVAVEPNSLRKTLLGKIKQFQQTEKIKNKTLSNEENQFKGALLDSMEYLEKRGEKMKQNKEKKKMVPRKNKTVKKPNMYNGNGGGDSNNIHDKLYPNTNSYTPLVSIDLPSSFGRSIETNDDGRSIETNDLPSSFGADVLFNNQRTFAGGMQPIQAQPIQAQPIQAQTHIPKLSNEEPPNGCLKGGSKPTYRQYHNKTLKRPHIQHSNTLPKPSLNIKSRHKGRHNAKIRQKTRRTKTSTFKLGKRGKHVSVLIKNNATRRKVKREHGVLKQKGMAEIKKYLYDKNLLHIGSTAPPDILRTMYEQSILAGDITNVGINATLKNFLENVNM